MVPYLDLCEPIENLTRWCPDMCQQRSENAHPGSLRDMPIGGPKHGTRTWSILFSASRPSCRRNAPAETCPKCARAGFALAIRAHWMRIRSISGEERRTRCGARSGVQDGRHSTPRSCGAALLGLCRMQRAGLFSMHSPTRSATRTCMPLRTVGVCIPGRCRSQIRTGGDAPRTRERHHGFERN